MSIRSENFCMRFKVNPLHLNYKEPNSKEREHIDKINKKYKLYILFGDIIASAIIGGILFYHCLQTIFILIIVGAMLLSCIPFMLKQKKYGVFRGIVAGKLFGSGPSVYCVNIWSEEEKQYAIKIPWKGMKKFDDINIGDEIVVYLSENTYFAEEPIEL